MSLFNNNDDPYDKEDNPEIEIEVTVSVTLSKTLNVKVKDYEILDEGIDEDGIYYINRDFSNCDLKKAVEKNITLPQDILDWDLDEYIVI